MTDDKPFASTCKANGCPLPVTVVTHWHEVSSKKETPRPRWGVCDYHHAAPGEEWTAITRRIMANKKCLQILHAVSAIEDERYKPLDFEKVSEWLQRMSELMRHEILQDDRADLDYQPAAFDLLYQRLS